MKSDVMICKSCVFPTDLDAHALVCFFSIWSASRKTRTLKSTSACTRRRRCISNAFSSSLRKITNLKRKLAGTSFVILLLETCFSSTVFCCSPSTHQLLFVYYVFVSLLRTSNLTTSLQNQIQSLRDGLSKANEKENALNKKLESRNEELQEKLRTITQVKKIGRRYKTQYDELKVDHDKVRASQPLRFSVLPKHQGLIYLKQLSQHSCPVSCSFGTLCSPFFPLVSLDGC